MNLFNNINNNQVIISINIMCQCTPDYDVRCLCTPTSATWGTCPERLRYTQFIIENTVDFSPMNIHVDAKYINTSDANLLINDITAMNDIKKYFVLTDLEMDDLMTNIQIDWMATDGTIMSDPVPEDDE